MRCALCGADDEPAELCGHHVVTGDDWAAVNRRCCDFLHRGVLPPRAPDPAVDPAAAGGVASVEAYAAAAAGAVPADVA